MSQKWRIYGLSDNGERCWIVCDGKNILAYNRRGIRMSAPPEGAQALLALGSPCIVDGERLIGKLAGHYIIFDLMQWNGQDIREKPYKTRIETLQRAMLEAKLIDGLRSTPSYISARANSTREKLTLLTASTGAREETRQLITWLRDMGEEGVIIRLLAGTYHQGRAIQKFKFLSDIDAVVIGFESGSSEGSVQLGLYRPADGAIIGIGKVRAGLTDADIVTLKECRARGAWPVLTVRYLGARTVGINLVEPQTSLTWLRSDKLPTECTSNQFGDEKATYIEQAERLPLSFFHNERSELC
jgi:ATP-dependent DNA ligase